MSPYPKWYAIHRLSVVDSIVPEHAYCARFESCCLHNSADHTTLLTMMMRCRFGKDRELVQLQNWEADVAAFKQAWIYPKLVLRDAAEKVNYHFMSKLTDERYMFSRWKHAKDVRNEVRPKSKLARCALWFSLPGSACACQRLCAYDQQLMSWFPLGSSTL